MALFGGKKAPLVRLKALDWKTDEERKELFDELLKDQKLKLKDVIWTISAAESEIRQLGVLLMPRFLNDGLARALMAELKEKTEAQQRFIVRQIARCSTDEVKECARDLLGDPDAKRRRLGMELINALPVAKAGELVREMLDDKNAEVRVVGVSKLLEDTSVLKEEKLRKKIISLASDPDERVRVACFRTLAATEPKDAEIWRVVVNGIKDESYSISQLSSDLLSKRIHEGDAELEQALIQLLADGSTTVRSAVLKALLASPDRSRVIRNYLSYTRTLAGWVRDRALESLKAFSKDLVEPVIELMHDEDEEIRLLALVVGGNFEDDRCVEPIIRLLGDPDWWTRATAVETLGRIGDPRAVPHLLKLLDDEEARWTAIDALKEFKDPKVIEPISKLLSNPAPEIRTAALEALTSFGSHRSVVEAMERTARDDENRTVRDRAMELLRRINDQAGVHRNLEELEAASRQSATVGKLSEMEQLLVEVRNAGGSDLHLSVGVPVHIRVHGELAQVGEEVLTDKRIRELVDQILNDRQRTRLGEDLQLDFCYTVPNVGRYRSNVFVQRMGMGAVFRVIPGIPPTFREIGMPDHMTDLVNYHQGLIVVAGPSGSGKSTTLAALVNLFNESKRAHILTIEDPVEFVHPMKNSLINQREVGKHTQTFAASLKGALREDPDVIMVGEMRDNETIKMAMEAAETGHLVIATLNTTTAAKTVDRLIESFPPGEQPQVRMGLSESLKAIICQQLLPRHDTRGRVAVFEIILGTNTVRTMIRDNKTYQLYSAMQMGRSKGMQTVDVAMYNLVQSGKLDPELAYNRAKDKEMFEPLVSPAFLRMQLGGEVETPVSKTN